MIGVKLLHCGVTMKVGMLGGMEWFGLQFNYSIETDLQPASQVLQAENIENYKLESFAATR
jgi:hypothetical protein